LLKAGESAALRSLWSFCNQEWDAKRYRKTGKTAENLEAVHHTEMTVECNMKGQSETQNKKKQTAGLDMLEAKDRKEDYSCLVIHLYVKRG